MDWTGVVEKNQGKLRRILAMLVAMAGLDAALPFSPCGRRCLREAKADEGSVSADGNPSSDVDCVRATFSHKGRREVRIAEYNRRDS